MPDYRIVVQIDPSAASSGRATVERELGSIEKASQRLQASLDRALAFQGAAAGVQSTQDLAAAQINAASAAERHAVAESRAAAATKAATATNEAATSSLREMSAAVVQTNNSLVEAARQQQRFRVGTQDFNAHLEAHQRHLANAAKQTKTVGETYKLTSQQALQLGYQVNDLVTQVASGANVFQALAQQGGQVFQALQMGPGGVGGSISAILRLINPTVLGITALTGAFVAFTLVAKGADDAATRFEQLTYGLGRNASTTAQQYEELAKRAADAGKISIASAQDQEATFVRMGITTTSVLQQAIASTRDFAAATGTDASGAVTSLGNALQDPIQGMETLDKKIGGFDANTRTLITTLVQQNRISEAQAVLLEVVADRTAKAADEVRGLSSAWEQAKRAASDYAKQAGISLSKFLKPDASQLTGRFGYDPVQERQKEAQATREAAAEQDRLNKAGVAAAGVIDSLMPKQVEINKLTNQRIQLNKLLSGSEAERAAKIAATGRTEAQVRSAIAEADKKIKELGTSDADKKAQREAETRARQAASRLANLKREQSAVEANISGLNSLALAYNTSTAAGIREDIQRKASVEAARKQISVSDELSRQRRLFAAEAFAASAKSTAELRDQTEEQRTLNDQVAAGTLTLAEAAEQLRDWSALRQTSLALDVATGDEAVRLQQALMNQTLARREANDEAERTRSLQVAQSQSDELAYLDLQLKLITSSNQARAVELAQLQAKQAIVSRGGDPTSNSALEEIRRAGEVAAQQLVLRQNQEAYNLSLTQTRDLLSQSASEARSLSDNLTGAFGRFGSAIGGVVTNLSDLAVKLEDINVEREKYIREGGRDEQRLALFTRQAAQARADAYGDALSSAKTFFKENSKGYAVLQAAERTYRVYQLAMSVKSIIAKSAEAAATATSEASQTASVTAGAATRAAANSAEGVSKIFAQLGWLAFPVAAAAIAFMASAGVGAKGSGRAPNVSEDRQASQGTGSVLGDAQAKSESIAKSLERAAANTNKSLEYENQMLKSLRAIESGIDSLTSRLAQELRVGGALDTASLGLGTTSKGPSSLLKFINPMAAIFPGLFGSKTTNTLVDQGLQFGSGSLADLVNGGLTGNAFQTVQSQTTKKFLGVTYSNKTSTNTSSSALEDALLTSVTDILSSLRQGVLDAASLLGVEGAQATLDAFQVSLGTISLKDMTGDEIKSALEAIFSKVGDDLASATIPGLDELRKAGEGALETLTRVARNYQVLDTSLLSIGQRFADTGLSSLKAREAFIDLVGGIDDFVEKTQFFADNFLTDAERLAPVQQSVTTALDKLNLSYVDTREEFKNVVLSLDLTTQSGQATYAALMNLAPAFDQVASAAEAAAEKQLEEQKRLDDERKRQQSDQRNRILQLMEMDDAVTGGNTALIERRKDEQALLDPISRDLQRLIDARKDEQAEVDRQRKLAQENTNMAIRLAQAAGDADLVTQLRRQQELNDATSNETREKLKAVFAAEDLTAATARLRSEQQELANLDIRLAQARGNEDLATQLRREQELAAATSDATRARLREIYAAEDFTAAAQKAAASLQEAESAVSSAREALQQAYEAEKDRLQSVIDAEADAIKAVEDAEGRLRSAFERARGELEDTVNSIGDLVADLASYRRELVLGDPTAPASEGRTALAAELQRVLGLAPQETAKALKSVGDQFLDNSRAAARTRVDYLRDRADVLKAAQDTEDKLGDQLSTAELQLQALNNQERALVGLDKSVESLEDAINNLQSAKQASAVATAQAEQARAALQRLDQQVAGLLEVKSATLSVQQAIIGLDSAMRALAAARSQSTGTQTAPPVTTSTGQSQVDNSSNPSTSDGKFTMGDYLDYDYHVWLREQLDKQIAADAAKSADQKAAEKAAADEAGRKFLESVWGPGYPIGSLPGFADGAAFTNGIVNQASLFNMGLMGENGSEAIMPLRRGASGRLGVEMVGGRSVASGRELARLEKGIEELRRDFNTIGSQLVINTGSAKRDLRKAVKSGIPVRAVDPAQPIQVETV